MSSIFTKIKHGFQHLGHDIEKVGKSALHGVEHLGKKLLNDVKNVLKDTLDLTEALMQGNMKLAMKDLAKLGSDLEKTAVDAGTGATDVALTTLGDLHLGKGFDKLVDGAQKGLETVKDALNKGTNAGLTDLANSAEGMVEHSINAVKDLAHGDVKGMMGELGGVGKDALNLAADLTPEGMGSTIAASSLSALHIGNDKINGTIAGLMHGNVGKVVKSTVETGANMGAQAMANGTASDAAFGGATVMTMASLASGGRGRKGGGASTTNRVSMEPSKASKGEHKTEKTEHKDDKKKDKKDEKEGNDNDQGSNNSPKIFVLPTTNDAFTRNLKRI